MSKTVTEEQKRELARAALFAVGQAYAPYSHFPVGAAVLTEDGTVVTGSNVENASYPAGSCAERTAAYYAAAHGHRKFRAVAVAGGRDGVTDEYCAPCGVCRQVLREFSDPEELMVLLVRSENDFRCLTLAQLLPESFGPEMLGGESK